MFHMDAFEMATIAKGYSDSLLCLLFVETLGGLAISWFLGLEANSIASFEDMRNAFLRRFKLLAESTISIAQLFHQQQRPDESLRAFLTRWLSTVGQCRDLDKRTALQAFKHCLLPGEFSFSLNHHHKNTPYDDIMDVAATYAEDEEVTFGASRARPVASAACPAQQGQFSRPPEQEEGAPARQESRNAPASAQRWPRKDGHLPADKVQARTLVQRAQKYFIMGGRLYRKGDSHPHMRCVTIEQGQQILHSLHSGLCGNHTGFRALVNRVMRTGYFWITMKHDAQDFVRKCVPCQEFANFKRTPNVPLVNIMSPWVHAVWGLDIIGQLPTAKGQLKYIVVAVDYFTKWIEAEALACISTSKITRFLWRNVYCRYGVPQTIVTDNGTQFNNPEFISFAQDLGTTVRFASVAHPQANGQVEAVNKKIMQLLKRSLGDAKGSWAELLPEVLWALRTTPTEATGRTPFSLMFGSECVLPIEQVLPTARVVELDEAANANARCMDLDLLEEERVTANI